MTQPNEADSGKSWLQDKLARLEAIYQKFGRAGLSEHPLPDVNLLLQKKEMEFRDMPKGRDLMEHQKVDARQLELEIKDLKGYVQSQIALVMPYSLQALRQYTERKRQEQPEQQYQKDDKSRGR